MSGQDCAMARLSGHSLQPHACAHPLRCVAVYCSCTAMTFFGQNVAELLASVATNGVYYPQQTVIGQLKQ